MNTSCKNCIFAEYKQNTQTGCAILQLNILKNHNIEIVEAYDEEKEFYVINNNKCLYYRTSDWNGSSIYSRQKQLQQIEQEIAIQYHAIIFSNDNLNDIDITLRTLFAQRIPPKHITIIRKKHHKTHINSLCNLLKPCTIKWRVENLLRDYTDEEIIDLIIPFIKLPIYAIFQAGFSIPLNTFYDLNNKIHHEFYPFFISLPNSTNNGMIVSRKLHLLYNGNKGLSLISKLQEEKCPYLIPISQLIPNFPK